MEWMAFASFFGPGWLAALGDPKMKRDGWRYFGSFD